MNWEGRLQTSPPSTSYYGIPITSLNSCSTKVK